MYVKANFASMLTTKGIKIFRYDTELNSQPDVGKIIALVYMLNPGSSRPISEKLFNDLSTTPMATTEPVLCIADNTMCRVKALVEEAYNSNALKLPVQYTIHIENLFNLREHDNQLAKRLYKQLPETNPFMHKQRELNFEYPLVWFALGNTKIRPDRQLELFQSYQDHLAVHQLNVNGIVIRTTYPVHPLFMNTQYFVEACNNKIKRNQL
jgi:hypothetical protein